MQKVSDASGAKYTAGGSAPLASAAPPPVAKKPVFTPSTSSASSSFNPLVAARNRRPVNADDDGWGDDAPQVSRTQLEKVESAYKPTKVNMAELTQAKPAPSRFGGAAKQDDQSGDVVKGAYQPVGKVDIAAIRAQAKRTVDDRPTPVKGSYEPVGKVDIAAIRARAQRPTEPAEPAEDTPEPPKSLADRSAAFQQSERLTELPKPKVAKKFGGSAFTGTKPPTPGALGLGSPTAPAPPPVGAASRTFADQGGKTPAQIWAEKKGKAPGAPLASAVSPPLLSPMVDQKSGSEWKSGYAGKSWATVQTSNFGRGGVETQRTGSTERSEPDAPKSPAGGVSALRDRFKDSQPMGTTAPSSRAVPSHDEDEYAPPPLPSSTRPSGGFALPGLPSRPVADEQEAEEEEEAPAIPSRDYEEEDHSPVRIAMPVARSQEPHLEPAAEQIPSRPIPAQRIEEELPREEDLPEEEESYDPRAAAAAVAQQSVNHAPVADAHTNSAGGRRAVAQYDYEKAEDNELELREGELVTNIEMVDDDWWMGSNSRGESGLFPSNYVELVDGDDEDAGHAAAPPPAPAPAAAAEPEQPAAAAAAAGGPTATALFDYEAAEDNGKSSLENEFLQLPKIRLSLVANHHAT